YTCASRREPCMTNRDAPHEFDPKHRIIGAIVVVALAVIFVPMILSQREAPSEAPAPANAPSGQTTEENKVAITRVPPPPPALTDPVKPIPAVSAPPAPEPAKTAAAESKPAAPAAKSPAPTAPSSGWVVQVGTFSNTANAARLEQKLRADGQPVRAEHVQLDSGKAVRLRVGPYRDRASAVKAQEHIQKDVGVKGVVLAFP